MTESQPNPRIVDPRGLRDGEFGDTATTQIPQRRKVREKPRKDVLRDKFGRKIPADFVR